MTVPVPVMLDITARLRPRDAAKEIDELLKPTRRRWEVQSPGNWAGVNERVPHRVVVDTIAALDGVLAECEGRTGARVDACRAEVTAMRDRLASAVAAFASMFEGVPGRHGDDREFTLRTDTDLVTRYQSALDAQREARLAFDAADESTVAECRAAVDLAEVRVRMLGREIAASQTAMRYPQLPALKAVATARANTVHLRGLDGVLAIEESCRQGAVDPPEVVQFYAAFEGAPLKVLGTDVWRLRAERAALPSHARKSAMGDERVPALPKSVHSSVRAY